MEKLFDKLIAAIEAPQKSSRRAAALGEAKQILAELADTAEFDPEDRITGEGE